MKLDALDHPKTHDLVSRLRISRPTAIGHLELLWAFTGKNAPQGDLGKWPDGAIASACDWTGDPATFIDALVGARLLARDNTYRLLVHDWAEHAPGWVRAKLKGLRKEFVTASTTKPTRSPRGSPPGSTPGRAPSILGKRSPAKPILVKGSEAPTAHPPAEPRKGIGPYQHPRVWADLPAGLADDVHELTVHIAGVYPRGTYGQQNWILAERVLHRLIDSGDTARDLIDAAAAYRAQQDAGNSTGTQYIRSPEKFYGEGFWKGPFPLPVARPGKGGKTFAELHAGLSTTDDEKREAVTT